jgi:hypothetical protein
MIDQETAERREELLEHWARLLIQAAHSGALARKPMQIMKVDTISGPRVGALEIHAGVGAGHLLRALSADQCAIARQFVPWHFVGEPGVFMSGRFVRVEAGWSSDLAETTIMLRDLGQHPDGAGRWIAGMNEAGHTVTLGLNDNTPHYLLAGTTGSGKTEALRTALSQLASDPDNRLVLLDGKRGSGLGDLRHLPGLVGPVATDGETIRGALSWVMGEMGHRYERMTGNGYTPFRLIVVFDEFQELTGKRDGDPAITEMLRQIAGQGRAARVHTLLATHHPTVEAFGGASATRRTLPGRVAMYVTDFEASKVAVGDRLPRADHLLGAGDAYCIAPGHVVHRVQLALVDRTDLRQLPQVEPQMEGWPEYQPESVGLLPERSVSWSYTGAELAASVTAAAMGYGRPRLIQLLEQKGLGKPGAERAIRLLSLGREAHDWLEEHTVTSIRLCDQGGD